MKKETQKDVQTIQLISFVSFESGPKVSKTLALISKNKLDLVIVQAKP
jgi:hypothetical protein